MGQVCQPGQAPAPAPAPNLSSHSLALATAGSANAAPRPAALPRLGTRPCAGRAPLPLPRSGSVRLGLGAFLAPGLRSLPARAASYEYGHSRAASIPPAAGGSPPACFQVYCRLSERSAAQRAAERGMRPKVLCKRRSCKKQPNFHSKFRQICLPPLYTYTCLTAHIAPRTLPAPYSHLTEWAPFALAKMRASATTRTYCI